MMSPMTLRLWSGAVTIALATLLTSCGQPSNPPSPDDVSVPTVAKVRCGDDGTTTILTPQVQAQPDGVHVDVEADASANLGFVVPGHGRDAEGGPFVFEQPPGEMPVACLAFEDDPGDDSLYEVITVVDVRGYYVDPSFSCSGVTFVSGEHPVVLEGRDPIEAVGGWLDGLRSTDSLERVGYVARERDATVAVRRDGEFVASAELRATRDGWGWVSFGACPDSGIRY